MRRVQQVGRALGSEVVLTLIVDDRADEDSIFTLLWKHITQFENQFSRFIVDSELSAFNLNAGKLTAMSDSFLALLRTCKAVGKKTNGLFNPFILPKLQEAGYKGSWPNPETAVSSLDYSQTAEIVSVNKIQIAPPNARIPQDSALDFGGIGKGYLLDKLAELLATLDIQNYWLSLGGDIICNGSDLDSSTWYVAIQDAEDETKAVATVNSGSRLLAIATSGVTRRRGVQNNTTWHHIIDPRTGLPTDTDIITATVCAKQGTFADVFAKCIVILGSKEALAFIEHHKIPSVVLQTKTKAGIEVIRYGKNIT